MRSVTRSGESALREGWIRSGRQLPASAVLVSPAHPIGSLPLDQVAAGLQSRPERLTSREAAQCLERFAHQLVHMMALLVWAAGAVACAARTPALGWAIWCVILIIALIAFWQEFQAERTPATLIQVLPRRGAGAGRAARAGGDPAGVLCSGVLFDHLGAGRQRDDLPL